jgi:hypothetical protein
MKVYVVSENTCYDCGRGDVLGVAGAVEDAERIIAAALDPSQSREYYGSFEIQEWSVGDRTSTAGTTFPYDEFGRPYAHFGDLPAFDASPELERASKAAIEFVATQKAKKEADDRAEQLAERRRRYAEKKAKGRTPARTPKR